MKYTKSQKKRLSATWRDLIEEGKENERKAMLGGD